MTSPSSNEPRGFALYVGITEDDAKAAGVSLQHIVTELKTTLNAMVPETHTHAAIALAPKGAGGRDLDIVENRHAVEYINDLEGSAEPHMTDAVRRHSRDIPAFEHHSTAVWLELPGDEVEQGGFARTVGSDDRHDISFFNQEIGIKDSHKSVERFLKRFNLQHAVFLSESLFFGFLCFFLEESQDTVR